jgi:hypothetical protein
MANWLDKYEQGGLVLKKKTKDNFGKRENANEGRSTASPGWVGEGTTNKGFDYNGAWGGTMAMGGALPGAVGFTYARTAGSAPANGKYTKKTKASAQNGKEMAFYQNGLDFKPKSISQNGSAIKDDRGQWAYPGEITEIGSNDITMKGVDYPVLGVSDTGDTQMMYPDQDYKFDGEKVTEYPMAQSGIIVNDLKNPRLKAYQDSLAAYNKSNDLYKQLLKMGREGNKGTREQVRDKMSLKEINYRSNVGMPYSYEGIKPDYVLGTRTPTENRGYLPHYKKPTQPVQYQAPKAEVKQIKGSKKYFINETEVDEPTFNKIVPKKEGMQNGGWLNKYK